MSRKIRWGIIGAGGIAQRRTLPAMEEITNAEIIAVMDKNPAVLTTISKTYGIQAVYEEEDALLQHPGIDAVYVASPVCFHLEQARKVLEAGKHLLLEKPMGLDLKEAEKVIEYARNTDRKVGIGMVMKLHPGHQKIREIIKKGVLGDIVNCRAQLTCWFPEMDRNWRQSRATGGGGALVDMGIHCVDLLRFLLDDEVEQVYGDVATKTFSYEVDDSADCMLRMKKGANCFVDVHFNIPDEAAKGVLEIYGTKGSILASGTIGQTGEGDIYLTVSGEDMGYDSQQNRCGASATSRLEYPKENIYAQQIMQFSDAILNDTEVFTTTEDAYRTARVIDALYRSSAEGRVIPV